MGFLSKLFKPYSNGQEQQTISKSVLDQHGMFVSTLGENSYILANIEIINHSTYPDGSQKNIVMARIAKGGYGDRINLTDADIIGFEIDTNQEFTSELCQKIIESYFLCRGVYKRNCTYLGILQQNGNGEITRSLGSVDIQRYLEDQANTLLDKIKRRREESLRDSALANAEYERRHYQEIYARQQAAHEAIQTELEKRKQNPVFEISSFPNQKGLENYDGIDIRTGEILRLRGIDKVGKDRQGTYLYTGFVDRANNFDDVQLLSQNGIPNGYAIAFETDTRLSDIAISQDPNSIYQILQLLSLPQNQLRNDTMTYIGKLDRTGIVTRGKAPQSSDLSSRFWEIKKSLEDILQQSR